MLSKEAHQIILGSLLGDMYCKREYLNSNIEETHSIKQKDYLLWKYGLLKDHLKLNLSVIKKSPCKAKGKIYNRKEQVRFRSNVSEALNFYYDLFYKNGKKELSIEILNELGVLGLAVWYCDDGHYDLENRTVQIHTEGFSIKENEMIRGWFIERWNLKSNFKKDPSKMKVLLRFPIKESDKFLKLISKELFRMPESIWYKLGHLWEGNFASINKAKFKKIKRAKIYNKRDYVKVNNRKHAKKSYYLNREKMLKKGSEFRMTDKYKNYIKNYLQKPDVKERRRKYLKIYRSNRKYKDKFNIYQREYRRRPEVRERINSYRRKNRNEKKT